MNKIVSMDEIISLIKEQIENNGEVSFTPKGNSMLPLFRNNRDTVVIGKATKRLEKYQIALYVRKSGQYVLHRVIKVNADSYVMRGDNQFVNEFGIRHDQIIGAVNSFTRNGKKYRTDNKIYKVYCILWVGTVKMRKCLWICRKNAGKIKRKILGD